MAILIYLQVVLQSFIQLFHPILQDYLSLSFLILTPYEKNTSFFKQTVSYVLFVKYGFIIGMA